MVLFIFPCSRDHAECPRFRDSFSILLGHSWSACTYRDRSVVVFRVVHYYCCKGLDRSVYNLSQVGYHGEVTHVGSWSTTNHFQSLARDNLATCTLVVSVSPCALTHINDKLNKKGLLRMYNLLWYYCYLCGDCPCVT